MIDFRYHALSLVAVFLALAIGILLGVTIGDALVSEADRGLRESLEQDVVEARAASEEATADVEQRDRLIEEALPIVAGSRLDGQRVALVAFAALPEEMESSLREAVEAAGGTVDSISILPPPGEVEQLREALGARPFDEAPGGPGLRAIGRRTARAIVAGNGVAERLSEELSERFSGGYRGADAVVVHREPPGDDDSSADRFAGAVLDLLARTEATVVGVEASDTDPSQIPFYERRPITTVDSADLPGGQAALVLALAGARGDFGFKETADELLPEPPRRASAPTRRSGG